MEKAQIIYRFSMYDDQQKLGEYLEEKDFLIAGSYIYDKKEGVVDSTKEVARIETPAQRILVNVGSRLEKVLDAFIKQEGRDSNPSDLPRTSSSGA